VVVAAVALTVAAYYPLAVHPNSTVLFEAGDASSAARNYWAMHNLKKTPFTMAHDSLVEAPEGIAASTALQIANAVEPLFVLATAWAGYLTAINAYLLLGIALTAVAMFFLLASFRLHPVSCALCAIGFASSQWVIEQQLYGHVAFAHLWVFPLLLWTLLWARSGGARRGVAPGAALGLTFAVSSYLGLFASLLVGVFLLTVLIERHAVAVSRRDASRVGAGVATWLVVMLPSLLAPELGPSSALGLPPGTRSDLEGADLRDYVLPSAHHALYGRLTGSVGEHVLFFGYALTALAAVTVVGIGLRRVPVTTPVRFALLLVPASIWMSLPAYVHPFGRRVPLPDAAWLIGGFVQWWRIYARFGVLAGFAVAILAAVALDALVKHRGVVARTVLVALSAAILFEAAPGFPVQAARIVPDGTSRWLRAHPGGIVAVYPLVPWTTPHTDGNPAWTAFNWDTLYLQTHHGHPLFSLPRIEMNPRRSDEIRLLASNLENPQTAAILRAERVRYVVVRDDMFRAIQQTPPSSLRGFRKVAHVADGRIFVPVAPPTSVAQAIAARQVELARAYAIASPGIAVGGGFYGPESFNGDTIHWMRQDGRVAITQLVARPFVRYRLTITAFSNARPRPLDLSIAGRSVGSFTVATSTTSFSTIVTLPARVSDLTIHSDSEPEPLGAIDPRVASICLVSVAVDPVAVDVSSG
jgi:hypothetical protein